VDERRCKAGFGHPLNLDPAATGDRNVDVLSAGSHADANVPGRTTDPANEQNSLFNFLGRSQVRPRDRLDQRHAESVSTPDDEVATVGNLAAAVLFDANLGDRNAPIPERNTALNADDCSPLESRWNRPVEVLLSRDMNLVDDVATEHQALLDGDIKGLLVNGKRRRIVHLVGADIRLVEQVDDVLLCLELHQRGAVVLAEFRQRRPHVPQYRTIMARGIDPGGAVAEEFSLGVELLVDFESDPQSNILVVKRIGHRPNSPAVDNARE
jgi:hypothetical protein